MRFANWIHIRRNSADPSADVGWLLLLVELDLRGLPEQTQMLNVCNFESGMLNNML